MCVPAGNGTAAVLARGRMRADTMEAALGGIIRGILAQRPPDGEWGIEGWLVACVWQRLGTDERKLSLATAQAENTTPEAIAKRLLPVVKKRAGHIFPIIARWL